ncbi:MAG: beta-ketoacyl-[acyl-carrier-protein] synthase family protein [Syntrophobacteraceae bacterium]
MAAPVPVITGIGVVCALGATRQTFLDALASARCGIGPVDLFDVSGYRSRIGAQVRGVDLSAPCPLADWPRPGRGDRLGLLAAEEAIGESCLLDRSLTPERIAVVLGGGSGGVLEAERYRRQLHAGQKPFPSQLAPFPVSHLTDLIANRYGFSGIRATVATACSSSATAIGYGADLIRFGRADTVVAGASESLTELTFSGFNSLRSMDPETCRPFDRNRRGLVLGEGACILVMESHERAQSDGRRIYGAVLGYGISADAHHMTSPHPNGDGAVRCMEAALARARLTADAVDAINAHGTGTVVNDRVETLAIKRVFGNRAHRIPVSATKSVHGHCLGAAGAIEAAAALLALHDGIIPATCHLRDPDPECDLDYVAEGPRKAETGIVLSNSFAFGGNNTTLVLARWPVDPGWLS